MFWASSSGRIELVINPDDALACAHPGPCDDDVYQLSQTAHMVEQLQKLDRALVASELREWGAWDSDELADHEQNLQRLLWVACCEIVEELRSAE